MNVKKLVLLICLTLTSTSFAFLQEESLTSSKGEIIRDLRMVKRYVQNNQNNIAISKIQDMIRELRDGDNQQVYSRLGLVYTTTNRGFYCDFSDQSRAKIIAQDSAMSICYEAGNTRCSIRSSVILTNGYLGSINGTYYGYGCKAKAVVQGYRN